MAQKVTVQLVDDIDGGNAEETVSFGLDGAVYEIDLSHEHAVELRESLSQWVGAARKNKPTLAKRTAVKAKSSDGLDLTAVREWARAAGHNVSDRGRISSSILDAYRAAN
jgi:hypothetical protein